MEYKVIFRFFFLKLFKVFEVLQLIYWKFFRRVASV